MPRWLARPLVAALAAAAAAVTSAQSAAPAAPTPPPPPAFAAANLTPDGARSLAANCAICHGAHGRTAPGSSVPALAGRQAAGTVAMMAAFKEGKRPATVMHQVAKGYSDAEIAAIADYFAAQAAR